MRPRRVGRPAHQEEPEDLPQPISACFRGLKQKDGSMELPKHLYRNLPRLANSLNCSCRAIILAILLVGLSDCTPPETARESSAQTVENRNSPLEIQYAQGFDVDVHDAYKLVTIHSEVDTIRYLLIPEGSPTPRDIIHHQLIRVPTTRIITQSTTHLGFIRALEASNSVVGVDNVSYIYDSAFTRAVETGEIQEVGSGASLNTERLIALQPDLLLVSSMPGSSLDPYRRFIKMGIAVLPVAEWMEASPLGKAEWLKLFGVLLNQEQKASAYFSEIAQAYDSLVEIGKQVNETTSVIVGTPFQGTWYVPGSNSYRGTMIQQAGGTFRWSQSGTAVSFPVDFEQMYEYGLKADIWLDPGQAFSQQELLGSDARFADFRAFKNDRIYNSNRRLNATQSGNDYYESGAVNPQRILADLLKILHPELLPDYELYYYQPIR